jgi:anti-sigma factor RsiW
VNEAGKFDPGREVALLSAYVDGELAPQDMARIEAHLALPAAESDYARREIAALRRLKQVAGAMRLHEPPAEEWEAFWTIHYNRVERSVGWVLVTLGVAVIAAWAALQAVIALLAEQDLPGYVRGGIFLVLVGLIVLLVSVVRERFFTRKHTRYKDIIR